MEVTLSNYYGDFYLCAGRSAYSLGGCVVFCIATFKLKNSDRTLIREFFCTNVRVLTHYIESFHSEEMALLHVKKIEKDLNW
jgi:hypothetical protein